MFIKKDNEPGFYFYMKVSEDFEPHCESLTADGLEERLEWVPFDTDKTIPLVHHNVPYIVYQICQFCLKKVG